MGSVQPENPAPKDNLHRKNGNEVKEKEGSDATKASTGHDSAITRRGHGYWTVSMRKKKSSSKAEEEDDDDEEDEDEDDSSENEEDEKEVVGQKKELGWELTISKKRIDLTIINKGYGRPAPPK